MCVMLSGGVASLNPRLLDAIPPGWGSMASFQDAICVCDVVWGYRFAQPPAIGCHPSGMGIDGILSGCDFLCVMLSGGIAPLNHRLLDAIPSGWGSMASFQDAICLCDVVRWCRSAQPPAIGCHPFGMGIDGIFSGCDFCVCDVVRGYRFAQPPAIGCHPSGMGRVVSRGIWWV